MSNDLDLVKTWVDNALDFCRRNSDLDATQQSFGGALWGFMRAIAECDNCPGVYRIPLDGDGTPNPMGEWKHLVCPHCRGIWTRPDAAEVTQ